MFENSINENKTTQLEKMDIVESSDIKATLDPLQQRLQIWKVKHQLALEGSYQAIQQIKSHVFTQAINNLLQKSEKPNIQLEKLNFYDLLQKSNIRLLKKGDAWGSYEIYSKVPLIFVMEGNVSLCCINLQADNESLVTVNEKGALLLQKQKLQKKYGQSNLNLLTKFQFHANEDSIIIQMKSPLKPSKIIELSQKEKAVNNMFLFYPTKEITRIRVKTDTKINQKFYLLSGKICYYMPDSEEENIIKITKIKQSRIINRPLILAAYQQGFFNPNQFQNTVYDDVFKILVFEDAEIMIFQEQFLRDQAIAGLEVKRQEHLLSVKKKYEDIYKNNDQKVASKQVSEIQEKIIQKYKLSRKKIDKVIYGIVSEKELPKGSAGLMKTTQGRLSSMNKYKDQMITTSSSLKKEKCAIRIKRTTKKKI